MCNHYRTNPDDIPTWREYIGLSTTTDEFSDVKVDIWPKYQAIVARIEGGAPKMEMMQWGVPLKMAGKRPGTTVTKRVTNVRNLASPFWKSMLKRPSHRCLVPFSEFAEPIIGAGRDEHWFRVADSPVAAFAGIWRSTEEGDAFAFLTCEPNPLVAPFHPKAMPVVLHPEDYQSWMTADHGEAISLAVPFPSQLMAVANAT